jgi:hypothetical protein
MKKVGVRVKMHMRRGSFCCSTLNLCCRTTTRVGARNLKGCLRFGQNEKNKVKSGESLKRKICNIFLHQKYVFLRVVISEPSVCCSQSRSECVNPRVCKV